jgi:NAD(P)H-hydrate epimerase
VKAGVALLAVGAELRGAARWALDTARASGIDVVEITTDGQWGSLRRSLPEYDLIVDALLGTGTLGAARGRVLSAIEAVNASGAEVISVDIPSGLSGSSAILPGRCIEAGTTLALAAMKIPLAFPPACHRAGRVKVLDIGIPRAAVEAERPDLHWADASSVSRLLPSRHPEAHKGRFGHVLILAGSRGKSGAAVLMARACLRSGAGLVTVAAPPSAQPLIAAGVPEAMTESLPETADGALAQKALKRVRRLLEDRDVLAAGPGLGTGRETAEVVGALASDGTRPMILDADALNIIAAGDGRLGDPATVVLTPHPGEAARLLGIGTRDVQADRPASARHIASGRGCTVLLKGFRSLTADPSGTVRVNPTGNSGMATGGTGDVLAGIVAAWLGQGLAPPDAAALSAHIHGLAGDLAAGESSGISLVAGDLIDHLPRAYRALESLAARG